MENKADRLRAARISAGFKSTQEAATRLGVSASTYRAHENGQNDFNEEQATRYGKAFKVDPTFLVFGETADRRALVDGAAHLNEPVNAFVGDRLPPGVGTIPLYGHAVGGQDGEFVLNGNKLDDITAPPNLSSVHGAYAVTVAGESMEPRYFDGETVFVDPQKRVVRGDFVVAQIQYEEAGPRLAYIKRFIRHNADELVLEQFNPAKELRFPHANVVSVDFIVMGGQVT